VNAKVDSWKESEAIYKASKVLGTIPVAAINHAVNPIDTTDAIIMEYDGAFLAQLVRLQPNKWLQLTAHQRAPNHIGSLGQSELAAVARGSRGAAAEPRIR
jgi:hypothetical protein